MPVTASAPCLRSWTGRRLCTRPRPRDLTHAHPLTKAMSIPHGLSRFTVLSLSFKIHFPILIYDRAFLSLMLLRVQGCGSLPSRSVLRCMLALRLLPERRRVFCPADAVLRRSHYDYSLLDKNLFDNP